MSDAAIGFVGVIVGGVLSIGASFIASQIESSRERRSLFLAKLEELYRLLSNMQHCYAHVWGDFNVRVLTGKKLDDHGPTMEPSQVEMLMAFYFQELKEALEGLKKARSDFGEVLVDVILHDPAALPFEQRDKIVDDARPIYNRLSKAIDLAQERCVRIASTHVGSWDAV